MRAGFRRNQTAIIKRRSIDDCPKELFCLTSEKKQKSASFLCGVLCLLCAFDVIAFVPRAGGELATANIYPCVFGFFMFAHEFRKRRRYIRHPLMLTVSFDGIWIASLGGTIRWPDLTKVDITTSTMKYGIKWRCINFGFSVPTDGSYTFHPLHRLRRALVKTSTETVKVNLQGLSHSGDEILKQIRINYAHCPQGDGHLQIGAQ
jgi:hypothetical protein